MKENNIPNWIIFLAIVIAILALILLSINTSFNFFSFSSKPNSNQNSNTNPNTPLAPPKDIQILNIILDAEYKARDTYWKVQDNLGKNPPFTYIENAKTQHIDNIRVFFEKYNLEFPKDTFYPGVSSYTSLDKACNAGVNIETELISLYDELSTRTTNSELQQLINYLQVDSQDHLSQFRKCSS